MYHSLTIKNFRCFRNLKIGPLNRVNLIAGKNNVGKTALLEALWIHHGYFNPELGVRVNAFRGLDRIKKDEFLWELFTDFDPGKTIELVSWDLENRLRTLRIAIREHPTSRIALQRPGKGNGRNLSTTEIPDLETTEPVGSEVNLEYTDSSGNTTQAHAVVDEEGIEFKRQPGIQEPTAIFLPARGRENLATLAERLSDLAVIKEEKKIVEILRVIEPRLLRLTVQHRGGASMIYGDIDGMKRLIPLPLMGDGLGRLLGIALAIGAARNGVVLVDEIENGLHHTVMKAVWQAISSLSQTFEVQIFATTHSFECIQAAHQAFEASERYDFGVHRLDWVRDDIKAVTYEQEALAGAIKGDLEVR